MSPHVPFMRWCIPFMLVAAVSCGGGGSSSSGNNGTGNSGAGNSGTGNSGTGSGSASTGAGGSTGSGTASTGSAGTASTGSAGTASTGSGTASTSGSSSSGTVADAGIVCSNTDKTILPIDATGFVERVCDDYQIQGAWYCYADGVGTSDCVTGTTPYVAASKAMCLSGMTSTATGSYGAAIGLELNASGGATSVKSAYDATANNIVGFEVTITGSSGGIGLRLTFTGAATTTATQPFVELPGAGTYQVLLADTLVPASFAGTTMNTRANPAAIYDLQLAIPATAAVGYNYCITEVKPILAASAPTVPTACATTLTAYGNSVCAPQDTLGEVTAIGQTSLYAVQNNVNIGGTPECVQAMAGGTCAGFTATLTNGALMGANVQSFPSMIYGWQAGSFYGGYRTAVQLQNITSVPTTWNFTTPPGGGNLWDAAYDIWFAPTAAPATAAGGVELMVWQNYSGNQPAGGPTTTKTINGASYQVWTGTVDTWRYIAYRATAPNSNPVNFDLINFFKDAVNEGVTLSESSYLLGIQAGFEVTSLPKGATMSTNSFSASVVQ